MFDNEIFKIGDEVQLVANATFVKGRQIPKEYFGEKFVIRSIAEESYEIGRSLSGYPVGSVAKDSVVTYSEMPAIAEDFVPYFISVTVDSAIIRSAPMENARAIAQIGRFAFFRVVGEQNNFVKLENQPGWISLTDVKVIKND